MLGRDQWLWLENSLKASKAKINVLVSSIQVIPEDHRFEKWANFPQERQRLLNLLATVSNPLVISGDRHIAEISKVEVAGKKIFEITSSGMTHSYLGFTGEKNRHRIGEVYFKKNFGMLELDWKENKAKISIRDLKGKVAAQQTLLL